MNNTQLFLMLLIPMLGILTNVALFMYLAGRVDKLTDTIAGHSERITGLEEPLTREIQGLKADLTIHVLEHRK